ncbi:MAG TPA: hypothetical protein VFG73_09275 [Rhodanobacteraceae bacterium]|nr:hypothetical protein [Rhodanobacteraceae bacterium]
MDSRTDATAAEAWYRQPIAWLGLLVFALSMAGCLWMIQVSLRHDETPRHGASVTLLGVPVPAPAHSSGAAP